MNRRSIAVLAALLALASGVVWLAISVRPSAVPTLEAPGATSPTSLARSDAPLSAPDSPRDERAPTQATVATSSNAAAPSATSSDDSELAHATWIDGRVEYAAGTPLDERIELVAVGRKFDRRPLFAAVVGSDGRFRAAFAPGTRKGWLRMQARYSYLDASDAIDLAKPPKELVLHPRLGGCLRGRIVLDANGAPHAADVIAGSIRGAAIGLDFADLRGVEGRIAPDLTYEVGGLVPDAHHKALLRAHGFARLVVDDFAVKRGEALTRDLEPKLGTRVAGRVLDESGAPVADAKVHAISADRSAVNVDMGDIWDTLDTTVKSAANGAFELVGLAGGRVHILAQKAGFTPTKQDLGEMPLGTDRSGADIVLARGLSVAGTVRWPDGKPAEGAFVEVREAEGAYDDIGAEIEPRPPAETAADGAFRIAGLRRGPFTMLARAWLGADEAQAKPAETDKAKRPPKIRKTGTPWSARAEGVAANTEALVLTLEKGASIRGRVLDEEGHPLERFTVMAHPVQDSEGYSDDLMPLSKSFRDKEGRFVLEGLQSAGWNVVAQSKGALDSPSLRINVPGPNDALEFRLLRGASIAGIVVDPAGQPAENVRVKLFDGMNGLHGDASAGTRTKAKGAFALYGAPLGPIWIRAEAEGFAPSEPLSLEVVPSQSIEGLKLALRAGAKLTGEVIGLDGKPAAGSMIFAARSIEERPLNTKTDANGAFALEHIPPGSWTVMARLPHDAARAAGETDAEGADSDQQSIQRAVVSVADGQAAHVVLAFQRTAPVRLVGKIVSSRPVQAWIRALRVGSVAVQSMRYGETKFDGTYSLALDAPGEYVVVLQSGENGVQLSERLTVVAGDNAHDFVLPGGRIAGRVVDAAGHPAASVTLHLRGGPHETSSAVTGPRSTDSDEDGKFAFDALQPGVFAIDARAGDRDWLGNGAVHGCARREGIVLADGASVEDVELKLVSGAAVSGSVRAANGGLMPQVAVYAFDASGTLVRSGVTFTSNSAGRFTIDSLPPGRVLLYACTAHSAGKAAITARAGEPAEIDITLAPAAEIAAFAQDAAGSSISAAFELADEDGRRFDQVPNPADENSADLHTRTFQSLPAGKYVLRAFAASVQLGAREVRTAAGERSEIVLQEQH